MKTLQEIEHFLQQLHPKSGPGEEGARSAIVISSVLVSALRKQPSANAYTLALALEEQFSALQDRMCSRGGDTPAAYAARDTLASILDVVTEGMLYVSITDGMESGPYASRNEAWDHASGTSYTLLPKPPAPDAELVRYQETHRLSTRLWVAIVLKDVTELPFTEAFLEDIRILERQVARFEQEIWLPQLQKLIAESSVRGHSARIEDVAVLTYAIAGRAVITIENATDSITLKTEEENQTPGRMGIHSLDGTVEGILFLFFRVFEHPLDMQENEHIAF